MTRILILGYGSLGQTFFRLFGTRYEVRGVKRTALVKDACPIVQMSIQSETVLPHLAWADVILFSPSSGGGDLKIYKDTYLTNMEFVLGLIHNHGIRIQHFVLMGSTGVYPRAAEGVWGETAGIPIETPKQETLRSTEETLAASGLPATILRCGGMYGDGRSNFSRYLREGRIKTTDMSRQYISLVHQDDVCRVIHCVIQEKHVTEIYNVLDDSHLRKEDLQRMIAAEAGIPIVDTGEPPSEPDRLIPNTKLKDRLAYEFQYKMTPRFLKDHLPMNPKG